MTLDKKQEAAARDDFALHVALIRKQEATPVGRARFLAWHEGPIGLAKRLGTPPNVVPKSG